MSYRVRTSVLFSVLVTLAACGGGGGTSNMAKCPEGMVSDQVCAGKADPACPGAALVAMCAGGQWGQCACGATSMTGAQSMAGDTSAPAVAICGNGVAEGDEQCDGSDFKGQTCATLGMGDANAQLVCKPDRCVIDTIMCFTSTGSPGTGGTGAGGTGAGATGAAGTGM